MEQEEEDTDMAGLNWLMLLMTVSIAADVPYVDQCFWGRVTSTTSSSQKNVLLEWSMKVH